MLIRKYRAIFLSIFLLMLTACSSRLYPPIMMKCPTGKVQVTGYAKSFVGPSRIEQADIEWLEQHQFIQTNRYGQFGFCARPGQRVTLQINKQSQFFNGNYFTTQSATLWVPKAGISGDHSEFTFQTPQVITYNFLKNIVLSHRHTTLEPNTCSVAATITAHHHTLRDITHGVAGAKIQLKHRNHMIKPLIKPYYFGIFLTKTNPYTPELIQTSEDGGVLILNLPASQFLYELTATKANTQFSRVYFWCRPNSFINLSPPQGPTVQLSTLEMTS